MGLAGGIVGISVIGIIIGLAFVVVIALLPSSPGGPPPARGVYLAAVVVVAVAVSTSVPLLVVAGIVTMVIGGANTIGAPIGKIVLASGVAVLTVGAGTELTTPWLFLVASLTMAATVLVGAFDDDAGADGYSFPLLALSSLGLFLVVPETDAASLLFAVTLPSLFLGWPSPIARLGRQGAYAMTGVFMWIALVGGQARPETIVVAAACLGLMLTEPLLRALGWGRRTLPRSMLAAFLTQAGTVLVLAELPEWFDPRWSAVVAVAILVGATVIMALFGRRRGASTTP